MEENRTLSEEDIDAITNQLRDKLVNDFYQNLGSGVWSLVWKAILIIPIALAAYGAGRS